VTSVGLNRYLYFSLSILEIKIVSPSFMTKHNIYNPKKRTDGSRGREISILGRGPFALPKIEKIHEIRLPAPLTPVTETLAFSFLTIRDTNSIFNSRLR